VRAFVLMGIALALALHSGDTLDRFEGACALALAVLALINYKKEEQK